MLFIYLANKNKTLPSQLSLSGSYFSSLESYIFIPTVLPSDVTLSAVGSCGSSPVALYSCEFNIMSNNATSGSVLSLPLNGSIGQSSFITITFN